MNKRGFLLGEQTLKIIVAVICILLLLGLLFSLYSSYVEDKKLEQARESLDKLKEGIEVAERTGEAEVILFNPKNNFFDRGASGVHWRIWSFSKNEKKPEKCLGEENCLCICREKIFWLPGNNCDSAGVCVGSRETEIKGKIFVDHPKSPPTEFRIVKEGEILKIIKK